MRTEAPPDRQVDARMTPMTDTGDAAARTGLLAGRTIVVVGAGPGFGRTLALRAAAEGASVVVAARSGERLDAIVRDVRAAGGDARAVTVDVTDPDAVRRLREEVAAHTDAVHGLVYAAYAAPSMAPLARTEHASISAGVDLSVLGALRCVQEFTELLAADGGSVVLMASAVIHHSRERYAGYKIAKTALVALGHSLATELGPRGVRVNTVAPGYIYGEVLEAYFAHLGEKHGGTVEDVYAHTAERMDLRRLPTETEVADPVVFLLSGMASAVTGQNLTVDCGEFHT